MLYGKAHIGPQLEAMLANVRKGVTRLSDLTSEQVASGRAQETDFRAWIVREARRVVETGTVRPVAPKEAEFEEIEPADLLGSATPEPVEELPAAQASVAVIPERPAPPPVAPKAQDIDVEAARAHESDDLSPDVAKPEDQREKAMYDQVRAWLGQRWDHPAPGREQVIAERCWYVTRRWADGDLEQVRQEPASPDSKSLRSTAMHSVVVTGQQNARQLMETAPFLRFNLVVDHVARGKTPAQAKLIVSAGPEMPR